jgi:hypothetical protein
VPGQPKRKALIALLWTHARRELGAAASPVDWVCHHVTNGLTMGEIAELLAPELKGGVSRNFVSSVANHLAPDAQKRIEAARAGVHGRISTVVHGAKGRRARRAIRLRT